MLIIQLESNITGAQVHHLLYEVYKAMHGDSNHYLAQKIKGSKAVVFADGSKEAYALALLINKKIRSHAKTFSDLRKKVMIYYRS
ncbi:MAG: hypothetical protein ACFIN2_00550 [Candidatus Walczuchella monophlebidarum]